MQSQQQQQQDRPVSARYKKLLLRLPAARYNKLIPDGDDLLFSKSSPSVPVFLPPNLCATSRGSNASPLESRLEQLTGADLQVGADDANLLMIDGLICSPQAGPHRRETTKQASHWSESDQWPSKSSASFLVHLFSVAWQTYCGITPQGGIKTLHNEPRSGGGH